MTTTLPPLAPDMFAPECPSRATPIRVGGKWAGMIMLCLKDGPRRFSELRTPLHDVTAKVLAESLRAMERDGLVTRTAYEDPAAAFGGWTPRVEYALTPLGRSLLAPMEVACAWAREHLPELLDARSAYERRNNGPARHSSGRP